MSPATSAGILLFRRTGPEVEVLLAHPGGPFFAKKDAGAWSIPKGEFDESEDKRNAALRELKEETGFEVDGHLEPLDPVTLKSGKTIYAWAVQADPDLSAFRSNTFVLEWP